MRTTQPRRAVDAVLMRGGTSRGPVLRIDCLPAEAEARDAAVVQFVGGEEVQTDGVGGGNPTTSKLVTVRPVYEDGGLLIEYAVANIVVGKNAVDWSGTCGNMTATVPLYVIEEGIAPPSLEGPIRLRNTSTGGMIDTFVADMGAHERGEEARVTTSYLEPTGSVLGALLPTGVGTEEVRLGHATYQVSLVDVTHPYLFMLYDEVIGEGDLHDPDTLARIEQIRGQICVRLGLVSAPEDAARLSPAVPRAVLIHRGTGVVDALAISAISMGLPVATVPVTAAMCLAAASRLPSTLPGRILNGGPSATVLNVVSRGARMRADARVDAEGRIVSVSVERSARTILRGTTWI